MLDMTAGDMTANTLTLVLMGAEPKDYSLYLCGIIHTLKAAFKKIIFCGNLFMGLL